MVFGLVMERKRRRFLDAFPHSLDYHILNVLVLFVFGLARMTQLLEFFENAIYSFKRRDKGCRCFHVHCCVPLSFRADRQVRAPLDFHGFEVRSGDSTLREAMAKRWQIDAINMTLCDE